MPAVQGKSGLLAKLGKDAQRVKTAHEEHKGDATNYGIMNLPGGITGGIAQLMTAEIGEYGSNTQNPGKPYVLLSGVVHMPDMWNGVKVRGQRASINIPLCDTTRKCHDQEGTFENWWAELLNEIRKFEIPTDDTQPDDIEGILNQMQEDKPFYVFSTSAGKARPTKDNPNPTPPVFTNFHGITQFSPNGDVAPMADASVASIEEEGTVSEELPDGGDVTQVEEAVDWDALAKVADNKAAKTPAALKEKKAAQEKITAAAIEAGADKDEVENAATFADVVTMMQNQQVAAEEPEVQAEPEGPKFEKGNTFGYHMNVKQGNKVVKSKKATQCEILTVNGANETCTLKNLETGKALMGINNKPLIIKWTDLVPAE